MIDLQTGDPTFDDVLSAFRRAFRTEHYALLRQHLERDRLAYDCSAIYGDRKVLREHPLRVVYGDEQCYILRHEEAPDTDQKFWDNLQLEYIWNRTGYGHTGDIQKAGDELMKRCLDAVWRK